MSNHSLQICMDINIKNEDAYKFVQECSGAKYDLIIESNMLNPLKVEAMLFSSHL